MTKNSKQSIVKKNHKYFKAAKDINSLLHISKETRNQQHDYADQVRPKHSRYTAFECSLNEGSKSQERSNESQNSGKISSFSVSYYHK